MARLTTTLMAATALIAVAGCAKKRPATLPPPPVTDDIGTPPTNNGAGQAGDGIVANSDAAFRRDVQSNTINFDVDVYDIDPTARGILDSQAAWLSSHSTVRATIEGHCDERGTREYNLALGDRRANAAKNYLVAKGIDPARLTTISYGKERPAATGSDDASWAQNRRAVTLVLN